MKQQPTNPNPSSRGSKPTHNQIASAAYQLYVENGRRNGYELDDWLRAEAMLTRQRQETTKSLTVHIPLTVEGPVNIQRPLPAREHPFARDERGSANREDIRQKATQFRPAARQPQWRTARAGKSHHAES